MASGGPAVIEVIRECVAADLAANACATVGALIFGQWQRAVVPGTPRVLPYSQGGTYQVPLALAAKVLPVPTELGLATTINATSLGIDVVDRPARSDLITAVKLALDGEPRVLAVAVAALKASGIIEPRGGFARNVAVVRLDPRLPRELFVGAPSWHLMFDPWDEASGGRAGVLIDAASMQATSVTGRR